ncbi:hypothetical protein A3K69_00845 [Candidatus Bathyarchaeota archaeon RBG_16_57_9]|nr:MAG: hypothetical protein A3K69_00845 [Candidatus Bathyarchaeota archaeon RBG_16_57_9]
MCTLIVLHRLLGNYPVVALHNRYLGKDTVEEPPRRTGGVVYPVDVASGGTWIGFNDEGLLLAITNQETQNLDKPGRSRGLLALDILRDCATADEARDILLDPASRKPYRTGNFAVLDAEAGHHVVWDAGTHHYPVEPGVFAMGTVTIVPGIQWSDRSRSLYESSVRRVARAHELLDGYKPRSIEEAVETMMRVSADHAHGRTESSICWHHPDYMQTSSTIMAPGPESRVLYCSGNHCENPYKDYSRAFTRAHKP